MYETLQNALEQYGAQIAVCGCEYRHADMPLYSAGNRSALALLTRSDALRCLISEFPREEHLEIANWNKLYRRETIGTIRFEPVCSEDYLFNYRVFENADRVVAVPAVLYFNNRSDTGSFSRGELSEKNISSLEANRIILQDLSQSAPQLLPAALARYVSVVANCAVAATSTTLLPYGKARRYILSHYHYAKQFLKKCDDPAAKKIFHDRILDIRFPRLHHRIDRLYCAYLKLKNRPA